MCLITHYHYNKSSQKCKPVNIFPVTSPAMVIVITKRKKSRETNREKWGKALSRSQLTKFTLMSIYLTLAQGIVWKWQPESRAESGPFESKYGKFGQSRHGSSTRNIFLRYLSRKLSDICHFTICKIRRENFCDTLLIRSRNFPSSQHKQIINMCEICPNMSDLPPVCSCF